MPTITLAGMAFLIFGCILVAFTPKERVVTAVSTPAWATVIAVLDSDGRIAASAAVPFAEPGKILAWDNDKKIYRWVDAPRDDQ